MAVDLGVMLGAPLAHAWNATEERPAELAADYWKMRKELAARQALWQRRGLSLS